MERWKVDYKYKQIICRKFESNPTTEQSDNSSNLIPVNILPAEYEYNMMIITQYRGLFPFSYFNAVQSVLFSEIYEKNSNIVVGSPTVYWYDIIILGIRKDCNIRVINSKIIKWIKTVYIHI